MQNSHHSGKEHADAWRLTIADTFEDPKAESAWERLPLKGDAPSPRSDTEMVFRKDTQKLFMFGGWANQWYGDFWMLDVHEIVGPPYCISEIVTELEPNPAPATPPTPRRSFQM